MGLDKLFESLVKKGSEIVRKPVVAGKNQKAQLTIISTDDIVLDVSMRFSTFLLESFSIIVDDIVQFYEMLFRFTADEMDAKQKTSLVVKFTSSILFEVYEQGFTEVEGKCYNKIFKAVYIICQKHGLDFNDIVFKINNSELGTLEENGAKYSVTFGCSFDLFSEIVKFYSGAGDSLSVKEAEQTLYSLFDDNFEAFYANADEDDIKFLRALDNGTYSGVYQNMLYTEVIDKGPCQNIQTAIYVAKYFTDMNYDVLMWAFATVNDVLLDKDVSEENVVELESSVLLLLQTMGDCAKYQFYRYNIQHTWRNLIKGAMLHFYGTTLNEIINLLNEYFAIPLKDIETFITLTTYELIAFEKKSLENTLRMVRLLSNSTVYNVVEKEDSNLIKFCQDYLYNE